MLSWIQSSSFSTPTPPPPPWKKTPTIHTWRLRRFSPATARHSLSCGGGQSDCPSISTHTSPNSSSSCSNVLLHTSTMNGTLLLTIHCPPLVHANVWGKKNNYIFPTYSLTLCYKMSCITCAINIPSLQKDNNIPEHLSENRKFIFPQRQLV